VEASGAVHEANVLSGEAAATRDRSLAAALATPARVLAAVEAGHELSVAYPEGPLVGGRMSPGVLGVLPGQRVPDAGPLLARDGTRTSLRELLRDPQPQLWLCCGAGRPDEAIALGRRFLPSLGVRLFVISDQPPAVPDGVEALADPELHVHGRLGAVANAAYVVRPDAHLGLRCEPPDAGWLAERLKAIGIRVPATEGER
jgi:hypothetical protein